MLSAPVQAAPNDFKFTKFEADYYLSKSSEGRSTLKTVERLTAMFPQPNQNHGIERAIPRSYDGHATYLRIESVSDEGGVALPYTTYESGGNEVVRIGDENTYVHGEVTYVLTYTQRDVTKNFAQHDEFYWDTNGTEWLQPFDSVNIRVHMDDTIARAYNGDAACYSGVSGSSDRCTISTTGPVVTAGDSQLAGGENVTVALGFDKGTFRPYEPSFVEKLYSGWLIWLIISTVLGIALCVWFVVRYYSRSNRTRDIGTVVPEYLPPKDASVLVSEKIGKGTRAGMTAQIMDLAVRHYIKVHQTQEKSRFKPAEYDLEIVKSIDDLRTEEQVFLRTLFGEKNTHIGSRFSMKHLKNDYKISTTFYKNAKEVEKQIKSEYNLRNKVEAETRWFKRVGIVLVIVAVIGVSPMLLIASVVAFISAYSIFPLTDKGLALRRYLEGLKVYIGVAEEERLRMLQSPEGAEKSGGVSSENSGQIVRLYEKVLPYAVLFGQEKEWNKQLGAYYEQIGAQPDWYTGNTAFNAAIFATAMNDFSAATNSYGASTSSSGSGSSGGGSSGGGGGGGGGGGW